MSGLLWVLILTTLGYALGKTPVFLKYEDQLMSCLMLLPVVLLVFGLVGSLVVLWKKKYGSQGLTMVISRARAAPVLLRHRRADDVQRSYPAVVCATASGVDAGYPSCEPGNQRAGWFFHLASSRRKRDPL